MGHSLRQVQSQTATRRFRSGIHQFFLQVRLEIFNIETISAGWRQDSAAFLDKSIYLYISLIYMRFMSPQNILHSWLL